MKHLAIYLGFLFFAFAAELPDDVAAEVNGVKITVAELEKQYQEDRAFVRDKVVTKEKVLNDMISRALGIQKAKKGQLEEDPIVKFKMEDVLFNAQISKDLDEAFSKINVTDEDVNKYYRDFPEYRTAHILFRMRSNPSEIEREEALKQAVNVYQSIESNPSSFASLAAKYSQANNAPSGGDMGYVPAIRLAPEYFKAIKGRPKNTVIPPVRTQFGFHIIKILAIKPYKEIDQEMYKKIVYDLKRDDLVTEYLKDLQVRAAVTINKKALN